MDWWRLLDGLALCCVLGGVGLIWHAIQHPLCAGFGGGCAPDIAYLVPGVGAVVLGLGALAWRHRRRRAS